MERAADDSRRTKQQRSLVVLAIILLLVVFSPTVKLFFNGLARRDRVELGALNVRIPGSWMVSEASTRITAWKPCSTILCRSARADITIQVGRFPEEVWEHAARNVIRDTYSAEAGLKTLNNGSESFTCLELDPVSAPGKVFSTCLDSIVGIESTYYGERSLKTEFYGILESVNKT